MSDRNPLRALQDALEHFNARDDGRDEPGFFALAEARREMEALLAEKDAEIGRLRATKDGAYAERNKLVAALSKLFPSSLERHPDSDTTWEDDWRWIVFVDLPTGQASWHIHDSELSQFDHLQRLQGRTWDGHTTEEKYARLAALQSAIPEGCEDWRCRGCGSPGGYCVHGCPGYALTEASPMRWVLERMPRIEIFAEIFDERERQDAKWGEQNHPDGTKSAWARLARQAREECQRAAANGCVTWAHILEEEKAEAFAEEDPVKLREELVQLAAVAVSWIEAIDRRSRR